MKMLQESYEEDNDDIETCLISGEKLEDNHVKLNVIINLIINIFIMKSISKKLNHGTAKLIKLKLPN